MALLSGRQVTDCEVQIPPAGGWVATGHLDSGAPVPPGPASLVLGDLTLTGAIQPGRGGTDNPAKPSFVLAGGAGWRRLLPAPGGALESPSTVKLSTVLALLAQTSGELYDAPPEASLGSSYGWEAGTPADAVLADLVVRGALPTWRVQPNGRTSFTSWPTLGEAGAAGRIPERRLVRGAREVLLDTRAAAFLPGATLEGKPIARVHFRDDGEQLKALVFDGSDLGPLARLRRILLKVFPQLARVRIDPATGNLVVRAADGRIDLAGGGPAVARKGDLAFRLTRDILSGDLWISMSLAPPYVWVAVPSTLGPPTPADPGMSITIAAGSGRVTCG